MSIRLGIECFSGHPGAGKTYTMVYRAYKLINTRRYKYHTIYSNMRLNEKYLRYKTGWKGSLIYISDFEQLYYINKGLLLLDEINIWSPSALWQEAPREMLAGWAQVRKSELCVYISTQSFSRVYKVVREITHTINKMISFKGAGWFTSMCHEVDDGVIQKKGLPSFIKFNKDIASCYNTNEKILMPSIYLTEKTKEQIEKENKLIESVKGKTKEEIIKEEKFNIAVANEKIRLKKLLSSGCINAPVMGASGFQKVNKIYNKIDEVAPDEKRLLEFKKDTQIYEDDLSFDEIFTSTG